MIILYHKNHNNIHWNFFNGFQENSIKHQNVIEKNCTQKFGKTNQSPKIFKISHLKSIGLENLPN
jgi:hypothetical protein